MRQSQRSYLIKNYPKIFDATVDRILNSPNAEEQKHILMGFALDGEHPVVVPRDTFFSHAHLLGDSGSGKTSRGMMPLAAQFIGAADASVVVLDLKGDLALFHCIREEAERAGLPFRYFTNRSGWSSHIWNPFAEPYFINRLSHVERAGYVIAGLGLDHGEIYGGGFYTNSMRILAINIFRKYRDSIHSIADLHRFCADASAYKGLGPEADWENSRHLVALLNTLSGLQALNATPEDLPNALPAWESRISVEEVLTRPTVVYFFLQPTIESALATCIARLFLYSLIGAAALYRYDEGKISTDVTLFIDEAQQLATQGFPLILNQARSYRLGCILAHQSLDQLKLNSDLDLTQIVLSATAIKQIFRSSDLLSRKYIAETGGEAMYHKLSWTQSTEMYDGEPDELDLTPARAERNPVSGEQRINVQEEIRSRMEPNTIMKASADPALSLVGITENSELAQYDAAWTPVLSGFHVTKAEYDRRKNLPWPGPDDQTIVVPKDWTPPNTPLTAAEMPAVTDDLNRRVQEGIKKLRGTPANA